MWKIAGRILVQSFDSEEDVSNYNIYNGPCGFYSGAAFLSKALLRDIFHETSIAQHHRVMYYSKISAFFKEYPNENWGYDYDFFITLYKENAIPLTRELFDFFEQDSEDFRVRWCLWTAPTQLSLYLEEINSLLKFNHYQYEWLSFDTYTHPGHTFLTLNINI